jgi:hypothetical protein
MIIYEQLPIIDRSFGFDSAVEEAAKTIGCAVTEARVIILHYTTLYFIRSHIYIYNVIYLTSS